MGYVTRCGTGDRMWLGRNVLSVRIICNLACELIRNLRIHPDRIQRLFEEYNTKLKCFKENYKQRIFEGNSGLITYGECD